MSKDLLRYDRMVERALRTVVRESLLQIVEFGLPGAHHLYITFQTDHAQIELPDHLHEKYPEEMTIVLQHQYWDLEVEEESFAVTLSFNDLHERLVIPFEAITAFADPSVNFGLQLQFESESEIELPDMAQPADAENEPGEEAESELEEDSKEPAEGEEKTADGNVVALDAFRKK